MAYNQNKSQRNNNDEVYFDLMEHVGVLANRENGWAKEVNIVAWNGGKPKVDIRDWDPNHERMTKGITLFEEEAEKLVKVLARRYGMRCTGNTPSKTFRRVEHTEQAEPAGQSVHNEYSERAEHTECEEEIPFEDASESPEELPTEEQTSAAEAAMPAVPPEPCSESMAASA